MNLKTVLLLTGKFLLSRAYTRYITYTNLT
nr:MAG TPA: hypothetical protein [Bacteriophage sp.]